MEFNLFTFPAPITFCMMDEIIFANVEEMGHTKEHTFPYSRRTTKSRHERWLHHHNHIQVFHFYFALVTSQRQIFFMHVLCSIQAGVRSRVMLLSDPAIFFLFRTTRIWTTRLASR